MIGSSSRATYIYGIGGPGAPHEFRLDRLRNLGVARADLDLRFWQKRGFPESPSDVVLRSARSVGCGVLF